MKASLSNVSSMTKSTIPEETSYFECDYERNCTPLYKALETAIVTDDEDFDNIATFLESAIWKEDGVMGAPPDIQAKTWVTRFKMVDGKKTVEWSQLPLHLAIVGKAPSNIVGGLVKLYPQALRCTDDQQMLPLHLALRHSADDEIVAYLLMQFPDAVNAKGKNGRSPIHCALRARDKLRGIIIETFVEKTKARINAINEREKTELLDNLDETNQQLVEAMKDIEKYKELKVDNSRTVQQLAKATDELISLKQLAVDHASLQEQYGSLQKAFHKLSEEKANIEADSKKTLEKLTSEQLTERVVLQKKFDWLVSEQKAAIKSEKRIKEENETLRKRMEAMHKSVEEAKNQAELQKEMTMMQKEHLKQDKSQAKESIDILKDELKVTLEKDIENKLQEEVKSLQKMVKELEKNESKAKTTQEVDALRSEVDVLRAELRDTAASSAMKMELLELRKSLEQQLRSSTDKSTSQMKTLTNMLEMSAPGALETMSCAQLAALKAEAEAITEELKRQELLAKAKADAKKLEERYHSVVKHADSATKKDLAAMKTAIEGLKSYLSSPKSQSDILSVLRDIESMKSMLSAKETRSQINIECQKLEHWTNTIMVKSDGCRNNELVQMKSNISDYALKCQSVNDPNELIELKAKLSRFSAGLQEIEEATKISNEIRSLKEVVKSELTTSARTVMIDVTEMTNRLDVIPMSNIERKKLEEQFKIILKKNFPVAKLEALLKKIEAYDMSDVSSTDIAKWAAARKKVVEIKNEFGRIESTVSNMEEVNNMLEALEHKDDVSEAVTQPTSNQSPATVTTTTVVAVEPKKKNKLTKFFKRFAKPTPIKTAIDRGEDGEPVVPTFVPPSMTNSAAGDVSVNDSITDSVANGSANKKQTAEKLPPAVRKIWTQENEAQTAKSQEMEMTLALHKSMSMTAADDDDYKSSRIVAFSQTSNNDKAGGTKYVPSALRKVRSLDPRMIANKSQPKNVMFDPVEVVRSWSKTILTNDNEVELEVVTEADSRTEASSM